MSLQAAEQLWLNRHHRRDHLTGGGLLRAARVEEWEIPIDATRNPVRVDNDQDFRVKAHHQDLVS